MIKFPKRATHEENQSMSAMTDVVFLLLIFFIVTMSTYAKTTFINTSLPQEQGTGSADALKSTHIVICAADESGSSDPIFILNGIPHTHQQVKDAMKRLASIDNTMTFFIRPDPDSMHGDLVYILSIAHEHGFHQISIMKSE